jgi:hypothetical protein
MKRLLVCLLLVASAGCGAEYQPSPTPLTVPRSTGTAASATPAPSGTRTPMTHTPAPQESPLASAVAAILADGNNHLDLAPLPAGHEAVVDRETAVATVRGYMNASGPVVYVDHGLDKRFSAAGVPVWLVIVKAQDMAPFPVGPGCPSPPNDCSQTWAVSDYAVALVSDETGQVVDAITTMREVTGP